MDKKHTIHKKNYQKEIEEKKRRKRKIFLIIILLLILSSLYCYYLCTAEQFCIKDITIIGNEQLTQEEIYNLSGINLNDNIFLTFKVIAKTKLKQNPYVEDVQIIKTYPNKLKIEIKERKKQFQVLTETGIYIYIDEQGYILDSSTEPLDLIKIVGFNINEENLQNLKRLEEEDLEKMENILHIMEDAQKINIKEKITKIETEDEYILYLENQNITINLGDVTTSNINDKMLYVQAILQAEQEKPGTIFVNGNLNEGFKPYFRSL